MAAIIISGKGGNVGSRTRTEDKTRTETTGEPESRSLSYLVKGNALVHLTEYQIYKRSPTVFFCRSDLATTFFTGSMK